MTSGSWLSLSFALVKAALPGYALASAAAVYVAFREPEDLKRGPAARLAPALAWLTWSLHGGAVLSRWAAGGLAHLPWTTLYETLLTFSWLLFGVHQALRARLKLRAGGLFTLPFAGLGLLLARLVPERGLALLVPSLQSSWLFFHVGFAALAYACFFAAATSAALCCVRERVSTEKLQLGGSGLGVLALIAMAAFDAVVRDRFETGWIPGPVGGVAIWIAAIAWLLHWTVSSFATTLLVPAAPLGRGKGIPASLLGEPDERLRGPELAMRALYAAGAVALAVFFLAAVWADLRGDGAYRISGHRYRLAALALCGAFGWLVLFASRWRGALERKLATAPQLDRWSYQAALSGFLLLTLAMVTGAAWADQAWGRYWSWDPKQTWTLVTWLYYGIYLHDRLRAGASVRRSAVLALLGLGFVAFTFLGVNLLISGVHAFATG